MILTYSILAVASASLLATQIFVESYDKLEKVYYDTNLSENLFESYIFKYQKRYTETEKTFRFQVFVKNLERINDLNKIHKSSVFGVNEFADLTPDEFQKSKLGFGKASDAELIEVPIKSIPDELDYRKKNMVTDVKCQDYCTLSFIFSATDELESQYAKKHNKFVVLSEQYPFDCNEMYTCQGGGDPTDVKKWIASTPGALTQEDYPNGNEKYDCTANSSLGVVKVKSAKSFQLNTTAELKQALVDHGPLSIGLFANVEVQFYHGGILDPIDDVDKDINLFALLIGYGKDEVEYWIIKNNWCTDWGENGYMRITMNKCHVGEFISSAEIF